MSAPEYERYPLVMNHPSYQPAVVSQWVWDAPATPGSPPTTGRHVPEHGTPAKFPPVTVHSADDEEYYAAQGYRAPGVDGQAFKQQVNDHIVNPKPPGYVYNEYPKWVNGVLIEDPKKPKSTFQEYPKWVGDRLVHCRQEEEALSAQQHVPYIAPQATDTPTEPQALQDKTLQLAQALSALSAEQVAALLSAVQTKPSDTAPAQVEEKTFQSTAEAEPERAVPPRRSKYRDRIRAADETAETQG